MHSVSERTIPTRRRPLAAACLAFVLLLRCSDDPPLLDGSAGGNAGGSGGSGAGGAQSGGSGGDGALGNSGGATSGGTAGDAGSAGLTSGGGPDDTGSGGAGASGPADGGTANAGAGGSAGDGSGGVGTSSSGAAGSAGSGGVHTGGGAGGHGAIDAGGTGGATGTGGDPGTGGTSPLPAWNFDSDTQGWFVVYSVPEELTELTTLRHSAQDGDPRNGSLEVSLPYSAVSQKVEVALRLHPALDLRGKTLFARIKLVSGCGSHPDRPCGVYAYVKSGPGLDYSTPGWKDSGNSLDVGRDWFTIQYTIEDDDLAARAVEAQNVGEIGIEFNTGSIGDFSNAVVLIDSVHFE